MGPAPEVHGRARDLGRAGRKRSRSSELKRARRRPTTTGGAQRNRATHAPTVARHRDASSTRIALTRGLSGSRTGVGSAWEAHDRGVERELATPGRRRTQPPHVGVGGAGKQLVDGRDHADERELSDYEWRTVGRHWARPVVELKVQMRATGLAGVSDSAEDLAASDVLAGAHADAAAL
jgi:hypothetical protein